MPHDSRRHAEAPHDRHRHRSRSRRRHSRRHRPLHRRITRFVESRAARLSISWGGARVVCLVAALLVAGLTGAYFVRKHLIASRALAMGKAALEKKDWAAAVSSLKRYLGKYPNDSDMLLRY